MIKAKSELGITVLGSGSRGNATLIHGDSETLLIDAGFSGREMARRMDSAGAEPSSVKAILVSHEHSDHVSGLRACATRFAVPIYANRRTADVLRSRDERLGGMTIFASGHPFEVGGFTVEPFSIPHDAYDPVGFVVRRGDVKVGIATDLGHVNQLVAYRLRECDALIIESNHDIEMLAGSGRPWSLKQRILGRHGHLSNESGVELLGKVLHDKTRHVIMAHASAECNTYDRVEKGAAECLDRLGRSDVRLHVARQEEPLPTLWI